MSREREDEILDEMRLAVEPAGVRVRPIKECLRPFAKRLAEAADGLVAAHNTGVGNEMNRCIRSIWYAIGEPEPLSAPFWATTSWIITTGRIKELVAERDSLKAEVERLRAHVQRDLPTSVAQRLDRVEHGMRLLIENDQPCRVCGRRGFQHALDCPLGAIAREVQSRDEQRGRE